MKNVLKVSFVGLILSVLMGGQAFAYPRTWQANAQISVRSDRITATIVNQWNRPIVCSGKVFGRTGSGVVLDSWLNSVVIWPGNYYHGYVYTHSRDRFVNGWANVQCRWR